jgi:hypothetical protein
MNLWVVLVVAMAFAATHVAVSRRAARSAA